MNMMLWAVAVLGVVVVSAGKPQGSSEEISLQDLQEEISRQQHRHLKDSPTLNVPDPHSPTSVLQESRANNNNVDVGEERFIALCIDSMLVGDVTEDGLISAKEFADFLTNYCIYQLTCDEEQEFSRLPNEAQESFVNHACPSGTICDISDPAAFGFVYTDETSSEVDMLVTDMCDTLYPRLGYYNPPTPGKRVIIVVADIMDTHVINV